VWLAAAMLGSALTLASFVKALHAVFLRRASPTVQAAEPREPSWLMWLPMVLLAVLCIGLGVGVHRVTLPVLINPATGLPVRLQGVWAAGPATVMLLSALALGGLGYLVAVVPRVRRTATYVGGEILSRTYISGVESPAAADLEVTGVDFYREIESVRFLRQAYELAKRGIFDIYEVGIRVVFYFVELLRAAHSGVLLNYVSWVIAGLAGVIFVLLR